MLNRIIRLQAVVEVITNQTATALELLAKQQTQIRTAVYQNRLGLDFLLSQEGGLCRKFNLTNCCLAIEDSGQAVLDIASNIRKVAHVPVQSWKGIGDGWFGSWFSNLGGFRTLIISVGVILVVILVLPCLLPVCIHSVRNAIEAAVEKRAAAHIMAMWEYQNLVQN